MHTRWIKLFCALPVILIACSADAPPPQSPMMPYLGTWLVDYERSYEFVLANQDSLNIDSTTFQGYLTQMSKIIELVVADSTISLRRGRHMREFSYIVLDSDASGTTIFAQLPEREYNMKMHLDEEGFLHMSSSSPRFREMFIYRRAQPGRRAQPDGADSLANEDPSQP